MPLTRHRAGRQSPSLFHVSALRATIDFRKNKFPPRERVRPKKRPVATMAIGSCDNCDRKNVPVAHYETPHGGTTQCFICTADPWVKDPDPDPYGELADALQDAQEIEAEMRLGRKD